MLDLDNVSEHKEMVLPPGVPSRPSSAQRLFREDMARVDPPNVAQQVAIALVHRWVARLQIL